MEKRHLTDPLEGFRKCADAQGVGIAASQPSTFPEEVEKGGREQAKYDRERGESKFTGDIQGSTTEPKLESTLDIQNAPQVAGEAPTYGMAKSSKEGFFKRGGKKK